MTQQFAATFGLIFAITALALEAQTPREIEAQLKAAEHMERVEGDLQGAIAQYRSIAEVGDRRVSAEALIHMGRAYEKLGSTEARKAYERVVNEYADQAEQFAAARLRLAELSAIGARPGSGTGPVMRHVWDLPPDFPYLHRPSPDGRYYTYIEWLDTASALSIRDLKSGETRIVTKAEGFPYSSAISRDGGSIAYVWWHRPGQMDVRSIGLDGADERVLAAPEGYPEVHDWSPDGTRLLVALRAPDQTGQIILLSTEDGSTQVLKSLGWRWPEQMQFSPDGQFVVFDLPTVDGRRERDIYVLATDGSRETHLVEHAANDRRPYWGPEGASVIFSSDRTGNTSLWQVEIIDGQPAGVPQLLLNDFPYWPRGLTGDGGFYFLSTSRSSDASLITLDLEERKPVDNRRSLSPLSVGEVGYADWSVDGHVLVYGVGASPAILDGDGKLVVRNLKTGEERDLVPELASFIANRPFRVSPDGSSILLRGTAARGVTGLFEISTDTGSVIRRVGGTRFEPAWSPNGKGVYYFSMDGLVLRDLSTGADTVISKPTPRAHLEDLTISPDGRFLAYTEGAATIMVVESSGGDPRPLFTGTLAPWGGLAWTPDSRSLLFVRNASRDDREGSLSRISVEGGEPEPLGLSMEGLTGIRLHPDGRTLLFNWGAPRDFALWVMEDFLL
jgi:Tol biopolymer transport system component